MVLPAIVTFSSMLTSLFNSMGWYVWLQKWAVPWQSRLVAVMVKPLGINSYVTNSIDISMIIKKWNGQMLPVVLEWNCLGWQSMIMLLITLISGLSGKYSFYSRVETIVFGIVGTFLSNLFRMAIIVSLAYYWSSFAAIIVHDYFAMFVAVGWMIFFWWFSYGYILEEKKTPILSDHKISEA